MKSNMNLLSLLFASAVGLTGNSNIAQTARGSEPTFPELGLVRYYGFNEGVGTVASDSTGERDLSLSNSWVDGKMDGSYNPNGAYDDTGYSLGGQDAVTINFWLNKTAT